MACVLGKICKEKLAGRVCIPVKSFDEADKSQNHVPKGIGFIDLPDALHKLENRMVSYACTPFIQANDLQPCHTDEWGLTLSFPHS
jgi:hypothetical protein